MAGQTVENNDGPTHKNLSTQAEERKPILLWNKHQAGM